VLFYTSYVVKIQTTENRKIL